MSQKSFEVKPFFSIVMAVYNVEKYLDEAIESLIKQTFSFKDIELILVNDGSTDSSGNICIEYENKYSNIVYISKKNGGVSSARNIGIDVANGKYINFMDPDDKLDKNTLQNVYEFFQEHEDIKIATIPYQMFGMRKEEHRLNYKFDKTRVVNIDEDYNSYFISSSTSFFKKDIIKNNYFEINKKYGEDIIFVTDLVMNEKKYGLVTQGKYYYRKRDEGSSAIDKAKYDPDYYFPYLNSLRDQMLKHQDNRGKVHKYVQSIILYDLAWKLVLKDIPDFLIDSKDVFIDTMFSMIQAIDNEVISKSITLNYYQKNAIFSWKDTNIFPRKDQSLYHEKVIDGNILLIDSNDNTQFDLSKQDIKINVINYFDEELEVLGYYNGFFNKNDISINVVDSHKSPITLNSLEYPNKYYLLGELIYTYKGFRLLIPYEKMKNIKSFQFQIEVKGIRKSLYLKFDGCFSKLDNTNKYSYFLCDKLSLYYLKDNRKIVIDKTKVKDVLNKESKFYKYLLNNKVYDKNYIEKIRLQSKLQTNKSFITLYYPKELVVNNSIVKLYKNNENTLEKSANNYLVVDSLETKNTCQIDSTNIIVIGSKEYIRLLTTADYCITDNSDTNKLFSFDSFKYYKDLINIKQIFIDNELELLNARKFRKTKQNFYKIIINDSVQLEQLEQQEYQYNKNSLSLVHEMTISKIFE